MFAVNVVVLCGIVVTGGVVRLTSSGLGCPTFPECTTGSLVPLAHQVQGWHKFVEFGNRMLTFVVVIAAAAALVAAWRLRPRRTPLVRLAAVGVAGIFAQALLGGVDVLTHLNPYVTSAHFLLSIALIAVGVALWQRSGDDGDGPPQPLVRPEVAWLTWALVAWAALVIVLGTLVTGSGPHSGDAHAASRYPFDLRSVAWLHADAVLLFFGLLLATIVAVRLTTCPAATARRLWVLLVVALGQGLIGYTQYFTRLPAALVGLHLAGATVLWVAALCVPFTLRRREAPAASGAAPMDRHTPATTITA